MIKNIIFDMGQVLVVFEPEKFVRQLGYEDKKEVDYIVNHIYTNQLWRDMDAGVISAKEGHKKLIDTIDDKYKKDADILANKWWSIFGAIEGMPELVKSLYDKGYNLYLLSNASDDHPMYWQNLPYKNYFKYLYVSSLHKKFKPNKDIYEDFINGFNLKKEECIFIDDTKANVDAANEFGIKSHLFVGKDELVEYLENMNVV